MIPQSLIVFREALEAALIVGIVATYLKVMGRSDVKKYLYLGTFSAVGLSLALGYSIMVLFGGLDERSGKIFEGIASLMAAAILTYMIFWMGKNSKNIRSDLEEKVRISVSSNQVMGIFALGFTSVLREGLETVLFLAVLVNEDPLGTLSGSILGLSVVLLLMLATMGRLSKIRLDRLFKYSSILLLLFAAGLVGYGVHELIEAYENQVPLFLSRQAWDINPADPDHPLHEKGIIGSLFKSLLGYDGNPEILRVIVYVVYWLILGTYLVRTYRPGKPRPLLLFVKGR
jgi:high-affinity iron transporter